MIKNVKVIFLFYLRVGFNLEGENLESLKGGEYAIKLSCLPSQYSITNADRTDQYNTSNNAR